MEIVKDKSAAKYLNVTTTTLRRWRNEGVGPRWFKLGNRLVRYRMDDLKAFLESCSVNTKGSNN